MLKSDFHMHTGEDWYDRIHIRHTAKQLVQHAAQQKFEVLSITNHNQIYFNQEIKEYARKKGILLIPGAEIRLEGKDILLLDTNYKTLKKLKKIEDLSRITDSTTVIAPHPYFFMSNCLGNRLDENIESFHAIEFSHFYNSMMLRAPFKSAINGNARAERTAKEYHKPLVGTSDAHQLTDIGSTFSWVDSANKKDDVLDAIMRGRLKIETKPIPNSIFFRKIFNFTAKEKFLMIMSPGAAQITDLPADAHIKRFK
jgi:predicted metal-dependent phosphoesterase TrpH